MAPIKCYHSRIKQLVMWNIAMINLLTSHLGDSGMKTSPRRCSTHGTIPADIIKVLTVEFPSVLL